MHDLSVTPQLCLCALNTQAQLGCNPTFDPVTGSLVVRLSELSFLLLFSVFTKTYLTKRHHFGYEAGLPMSARPRGWGGGVRRMFLHVSVTHVWVVFYSGMGLHGLQTDSGRRCGVPHHWCLCDLSHMGVVGDEHHFIFPCPALNPVRQCFRLGFATDTGCLQLFCGMRTCAL